MKWRTVEQLTASASFKLVIAVETDLTNPALIDCFVSDLHVQWWHTEKWCEPCVQILYHRPRDTEMLNHTTKRQANTHVSAIVQDIQLTCTYKVDFTVWEHDVCTHTLGLGDNFSSAPTPTIHHWGTGSTHTAWALSPCANTTWMMREREWREASYNLLHLFTCFYSSLEQMLEDSKACMRE